MKHVPIFCSLLPVEFLVQRGLEPVYLHVDDMHVASSGEHHCAFHENLCSYSKRLYEYFLSHDDEFAFIIIPSSCDAMKKLYAALSEKLDKNRLFFLDFPKGKDEAAVNYYAAVLERLNGFIQGHKQS